MTETELKDALPQLLALLEMIEAHIRGMYATGTSPCGRVLSWRRAW